MTVEVPKKVHSKVRIYCNKQGLKIQAFVARVLLDAVTPFEPIKLPLDGTNVENALNKLSSQTKKLSAALSKEKE